MMTFIKPQCRAGYLVLLLCAVTHQQAQAIDSPATQNLSQRLSGNTLVVKNRYGSMFIHFDNGGRFYYRQPKGEIVEGTWRVADDSVCLTQTTLPPGRSPQENCLVMEQQSFGATWTKEDPRNGTITYKLLAGHSAYEPIRPK